MFSSLKNKIFSLIVKSQGGELHSKSLRKRTLKKNNVEVGMFTYGSCFDKTFNNGGKVTIGRYCSIADGVHYFGANHPLSSVSTSAIFYNRKFSGYDVEDVERFSLLIGNDVWIGQNVLITSSCKVIGNGSVIGAGSVVTHDVPPYAVVAGNPARIIKYRFEESVIAELEQSKWWENDPDCVLKYYKHFLDPIKFCACLKNNNK